MSVKKSVKIIIRPINLDLYEKFGDAKDTIKGKGAIDTKEEAEAVLKLVKGRDMKQYQIIINGLEYKVRQLQTLAQGTPLTYSRSLGPGVIFTGGYLWGDKSGPDYSVSLLVPQYRLPLSEDERTSIILAVRGSLGEIFPSNDRRVQISLGLLAGIERLVDQRVAVGGTATLDAHFDFSREVSSGLASHLAVSLGPTARFILKPGLVELSIFASGRFMVGTNMMGGFFAGLNLSFLIPSDTPRTALPPPKL